MQSVFLLLSAIILSFSVVICDASIASPDLFNVKWTYNDTWAAKKGMNGPSRWNVSFPVCDVGSPDSKQSPINIVHKDVPVAHAGVLPLTFQNDKCELNVRNIGATLSATPKDIVSCKATFTTLSGTVYKFYEAHLRWHHYYNHRGTEHRVDGQAEAVEAQLIHYNAKFQSIDDAFRDASVGNIAVLAVRYTVAPSGGNGTEAPELNLFIADTFDKIQFMNLGVNGMVDVGNHNPYDLIGTALPRVNLPMYHYNGSLTSPSCDSITSWYLVQQTVMLSQSQMQQLRFFVHVNETEYKTHSLGFEIDSNVRPVAPLNGRQVVAYPSVIEPNMSSDSGPESVLPSSSSEEPPVLTTGAIIGISVAGGVVLVGITVLITSLICRTVHKKDYESINSA